MFQGLGPKRRESSKGDWAYHRPEADPAGEDEDGAARDVLERGGPGVVYIYILLVELIMMIVIIIVIIVILTGAVQRGLRGHDLGVGRLQGALRRHRRAFACSSVVIMYSIVTMIIVITIIVVVIRNSYCYY